MFDPSLQDRRVIITAGGSGIGRAVAEAFAEAGGRVWVCDIESENLAALAAARPDIRTFLADVSDEDQVHAFFDAALMNLGGLDVLVNNAGIAGPTGPIEECALADWRRTLEVNLDGQFLCLKRAVPVMKAAKAGVIVNMSSVAGLFGFPMRAPYAASKWGVVGLTKTLAMELGPHGIRVNAICPGAVEGPRIDRVIAADAAARGLDAVQVREEYAAQCSLRTFIKPADIAAEILHLASSAGARISGQAIAVDGNTVSLAH